jgi:hypothetical protein
MDASGKSAARESAHRDRCNTDVVTARGQQGGASSNSMKKASHGSSMSATQLTGGASLFETARFSSLTRLCWTLEGLLLMRFLFCHREQQHGLK